MATTAPRVLAQVIFPNPMDCRISHAGTVAHTPTAVLADPPAREQADAGLIPVEVTNTFRAGGSATFLHNRVMWVPADSLITI